MLYGRVEKIEKCKLEDLKKRLFNYIEIENFLRFSTQYKDVSFYFTSMFFFPQFVLLYYSSVSVAEARSKRVLTFRLEAPATVMQQAFERMDFIGSAGGLSISQ